MLRPAFLVLAVFPLAAQGPDAVEFNRDVRPILADKCFICHGPDAATKKVPFRLDREEFAKADLSGGRHAIVEGNPAASIMLARITAPDPARRMPPAYTQQTLTDVEVSTLRRWIEQGAKWQLHWSLIPPKPVDPPAVTSTTWPRNQIDRFILSRLERENLQPQPEAARAILLRRASLDLTGLPPSVADLDAFLADKSPQAYEKAVDRLLQSPRYGERMAARWLDAARYADTNGYQYDGPREMWRWRDWVIDAFNSNKRYDRFVIEQLAGDLLPNATPDQIIATGFNRNHRINTEDGIVPEEYFAEQVVDRVETTSTVFLGMTLGCARCHNHKYDPLLQKDFYQMFAFFNSLPELGRGMKYGNTPPLMPAPTPEQQAQLDAMERKIATARAALAAREKEIERAQTKWETGLDAGRWGPATSLVYTTGPAPIEFDGNKTIDVGDIAPFDISDPFTISAWVYSDAIPDGSIASRMVDNPTGKGYGVHLNKGHVHVNITSIWADDAIRVESEDTLSPGAWHHVAVTVDGSRLATGVAATIDGRPAHLRIENATLYRPIRNNSTPFKEPFLVGGGWGPERRFKGQLEDVRVYSRMLGPDELAALAVHASLTEIARKAAAQRTPGEAFALRSAFLENDDAAKSISELTLELDRMRRALPTVMVMQDLPQPRQAFILERGAYDKPGEKVERAVPAVLPQLPPDAPRNRLGLARWIVDGKNPLTARVAVNRLWQTIFGTGLVKTAEDFGVQGEAPSHPELLDWLATEFVRSGWDVKSMVRFMVISAAYRQSSTATPELEARDPENRLLARGPRFRLSAEAIRDQALFASGLLVEKIGGPSVMPYQPAGLWNETAMQDMKYTQGHGDDLYRRGLYTFWKRTIAPPMMVAFDAPGRETCVVRESRTDTPMQALNLMNDVTFLEAARALGQRMMKEGGSDPAARLRYGFRALLSRYPSTAEAGTLQDSLNYHRDYFATRPDAAARLLAQGESKADASLNPGELAAYATVASLMLNLDEAVTKQ
jgi:mono/diheme cytochrome c family protein